MVALQHGKIALIKKAQPLAVKRIVTKSDAKRIENGIARSVAFLRRPKIVREDRSFVQHVTPDPR